jgi:hypothetical protein
MIYKQVDLHGIAEVVSVPGRPGVRLQRVPEAVREHLEEPARNKTINPGGAEIRLVPLGRSVRVTLSSIGEPGSVRLFLGPFDSRLSWTLGPEPVTIEVAEIEDELWRSRFLSLPAEKADRLAFDPRVCRLVMRPGIIHLHGIEGERRPPEPTETPACTMIAYGTSITHGSAATGFHLSYIAQTAWRLGCDLINLGVGGACLCESAFGDFIAEREDWDLAVLSLSVNMVGRGFTVQEFTERVRYLVGKVAARGKPVVCITLYPFFEDWAHLNPEVKAHPDEFRKALGQIVAEIGSPQLHLIRGPELLTDISGLTVDMLHPSDLGMIQMGENLAARLVPVVSDLRRRLGGRPAT